MNSNRILFFAEKDDLDGERLLAAIGRMLPQSQIEVCREFEQVWKGLRLPGREGLIAVLTAARKEDLRRFQSIRDLLGDVPTILIIPDEDETTLQMAHRMLPRYLSLKHGDFSDVIQVLQKMCQT